MERPWKFILWSIIFLSPVILLFLRRRRRRSVNLPPGPPGWPVFGHIFKLGSLPYKTLAGFKEQYGPLVWIRIGATKTMVILTAGAAGEFFKNHDHAFADRTVTQVMKVRDYEQGSMAIGSYGPYWRMLRRICTLELLVQKRLNETMPIRRKCINQMLDWVEKEGSNSRGIEISRFVFLASFNMIGNLVFSRDLADPESKVASEFFTAMAGVMKWAGLFNVSDVFPWLGWLDLQGLRRNNDRDIGKALKFASEYVKERVKEQRQGDGGERSKDFLDVLLEFQGNGKDEPHKLSEHQITVFVLEIFLAGSETSSNTTEWVLTELLRNPEAMRKVKAELDGVVGPSRKMEETDVDNLEYLQAVVKETLRLHPPLPFLIPRNAIQDTHFMGYDIPRNTQVFVNTWAIGRDPDYWEDPLDFKPERFLGSKIDYKGQHFELIPFGSGRRMCAGVPLAHRLVHFFLGSLIHEFDWELESHVTPETIDMRERMGMVIRKFQPLVAVPTKRLINVKDQA